MAIVAALVITPPIPQDPAYHQFADQRTLLGVPNALNVLSNIPFAVVGIAGLAATFHRRTRFKTPWERWPYAALFAGSALTAVGSSYYHLSPDNARLAWDRLPMTIGFTGLLTAMIAERIDTRIARLLFVPALAFGAFSVAQWHWAEMRGAGDLRWYLLVQFGSLTTIVVILALYPPRYSRAGLIAAALAAYAVAKLFELGDRQMLTATALSGHSMKHLSAALGVWLIVLHLKRRNMLSP